MSIADKITRLQTAKAAIASAITGKGGTVSAGDGYEDFAADIATIPSGITPTGTVSITDNGTHNVASYASAYVNVSGGSDPDLSIVDLSKFPQERFASFICNYNTFAGFTGTKAKIILPSTYSGAVPICVNSTTIRELTIDGNGCTFTSLQNNALLISVPLRKYTLIGSTRLVTNWPSNYFLRGAGNTTQSFVADGTPIDFSGVASDTATLFQREAFYQAYVSHILFEPNTLNMSGTAIFTGNRVMFDDESLVSLGNVLGETTTGTIAISGSQGGSGIAARVQAITGSVDTSGGFNLFVKDDSGTLTLANFITNVKGWTLA